MTSPIGTIDRAVAIGYDPNLLGTSVVTAVTATAPLTSSGGETPDIALPANAVTGWDDLLGPISLATAGSSAPTVEAFGDTGYPATFFRHDQNDEVYWTFQTSHRWDRTTSLYFHLHVIPMGDPATTQNVIIDGAYVWMHYGQTVPALTGWTAITAVTHPIHNGDIMKPDIIPVAVIPPGTALESDILVIRIRRPGSSNASDTYTTSKAAGTTSAANLCILSGDCHFQVQKVGTATEIPV